jgi:hypothetical protein
MDSLAVIFTSVFSSGVFAALTSASFTEAKERWVLRRAKIEDIYLSTAGWLKEAQAQFVPYLHVCEGKISYNQMLDLQINYAKEDTGDQHLKMKMNIEMYERSLIPALTLMQGELKRLNELCSLLKDCYCETGQASEFLEPMRAQLISFGKAGDTLLEAVVSRGAQIGAERGQIAQFRDRALLKGGECTSWVRLRASQVSLRVRSLAEPSN